MSGHEGEDPLGCDRARTLGDCLHRQAGRALLDDELDDRVGYGVVNRYLTPARLPREMAQAWLKHNVEEVGLLEHILPALIASTEQHLEAATR